MSTVAPPKPPATTSKSTALSAPRSRSTESMPGLSNLMDTDRFEQLGRVAQTMALVAPKHLQGTHRDAGTAFKITCANCFRVANQAMRWGMDPFAVMDETYVVHGKLAYQGKLVAGVVNTRANLVGRLDFEYLNQGGKADDLTIVVKGRFDDEEAERTVKLSVGQAKTDNEMWRKDPEQKLIYSGVVRWARAHCPEIILGIMTDDDLDRMREAGALNGGGDSLAHRSELSDTLTPEGDATAGNLGVDGPGQPTDPPGNAQGLDQSGEQSQDSAATDAPKTESPKQEVPQLSELARALEFDLRDETISVSANTSKKQKIVDSLAKGDLTTEEAAYLQTIVEKNAERLAKRK